MKPVIALVGRPNVGKSTLFNCLTRTRDALVADMPGVKAKDLNIDLRDDILTLDGEVEPPESKSEVDVFREYQSGKYSRQFSLSQVIDQSKIDADLKDGVLRLRLPKVEAATPRKIAVKAG